MNEQKKTIATKDRITDKITVIGAGLAGSECAWQLAQKGYTVDLIEMRPLQSTEAHKSSDFAELVCSNSFGSMGPLSAPGQLKWEAEQLRSIVLQTALENKVPAGQALGIDRETFAKKMTEKISSHPRINIINQVVHSLDDLPRPTVVATGPLTAENLAKNLQLHFGNEFLYFFDAIAPIVDTDSINTEIAWKADRYDKGTPDYWNCPLDKTQYEALIDEITRARKIEPKDFESTQYFEGCMPIEAMVERGAETLRFGPMKPVGLRHPLTGRTPYAVVQLRQDNREGTAYNMVGFQTRMAYPEQSRVFRLIPGLENAEFLKLGSIHRNLYINSPQKLNRDFSSKNDPWLFFAGQITGVEGYFESACSGLLVAHFLDQKLKDTPFNPPPRPTALGSLLAALGDPSRIEHFQPTNINFGLFPPLTQEESDQHFKKNKHGKVLVDKELKKTIQTNKAKKALLGWLESLQ